MSNPAKETPDEVEVLVRDILGRIFEGSELEDSVAVIVSVVDKMVEETVKARLEGVRVSETEKYRAAMYESLKRLRTELDKKVEG